MFISKNFFDTLFFEVKNEKSPYEIHIINTYLKACIPVMSAPVINK